MSCTRPTCERQFQHSRDTTSKHWVDLTVTSRALVFEMTCTFCTLSQLSAEPEISAFKTLNSRILPVYWRQQWSANSRQSQSYTSTRMLTLGGTSLKVLYNILPMFKIFTTQTTTKLFVVRVYQLMRLHFIYCTETLWTLTTYIRLHTFMST